MGTNSIQAQAKDGWKLLQTRQKQLESAKLQTKAVQEEYSKIQQEQGKTEQLDAKLAQKVMVLSNFNVKTEPKEPAKVADPGNAPTIPADATEKEKGTIQREFDQKKADFEQYQKDVKQYEKDLKEFKKYEALKAEIEKESPEIKGQLDTLMKAAQTKEDELKKAQGEEAELQREVDFSWDNYQELQKELETAKFDVTLDEKGDTLTSVAKKNIDATNIDGKEADVKAVYNGIVEGDKANNVDNSKKHYTTMNVGDKHSYTADQIAKMGADVNLADDFGEDFGTQMNALLDDAVKETPDEGYGQIQAGDKQPKLNQKPVKANDEIVLPRGIKWQGTEGNKLSDFGITDNGDGTYTSSTKKTYTAEEVNKWFREVEDSSGNNYSKYLDKAEKLGIDYNQYSSSKDLKEAVKAEEKRLKAVDKYSDEIKQYGIETEGRTADQIKADVKTAKAKATTTASTKVEVQKAESAPKKDQPAVKAETEKTETKAEVKTTSTPVSKEQANRDELVSEAQSYGIKTDGYEKYNKYINPMKDNHDLTIANTCAKEMKKKGISVDGLTVREVIAKYNKEFGKLN